MVKSKFCLCSYIRALSRILLKKIIVLTLLNEYILLRLMYEKLHFSTLSCRWKNLLLLKCIIQRTIPNSIWLLSEYHMVILAPFSEIAIQISFSALICNEMSMIRTVYFYSIMKTFRTDQSILKLILIF